MSADYRPGDVHLFELQKIDDKDEAIEIVLRRVARQLPARHVYRVTNFADADDLVFGQQMAIQAALRLQSPRKPLDRIKRHIIVVLDIPVSDIQKDLQQTMAQQQLNDIEQCFVAKRTRHQHAKTSSLDDTSALQEGITYSRLERYTELARRYAITLILALPDYLCQDDRFHTEWVNHMHNNPKPY